MTGTIAKPIWSLILVLVTTAAGAAAQTPGVDTDFPEVEVATAPVEVDGAVLFRVRSVPSTPAEQRAAGIAGRIRNLARDPGFQAESLRLVDRDGLLTIVAGEARVMVVTGADAALEGTGTRELGQVLLPRIARAVEEYRSARQLKALLLSGARALGATALLAAALLLAGWGKKRVEAFAERHYRARVHAVRIKSFEIVRGERLWGLVRWVLDAARVVAVLVVLYLYLGSVLGAFPFTRWMAVRLGRWVMGPIETMASALLAEIPDLIFLAVLFAAVRYLVRFVRLFFNAVAEGRVEIEGFDREWALPTYKLARLAVIAFGLVVAYPYIPGSGSAAFKGVSLFIGVVFSLGSSAAISNTVAGYALTYRRAFRVGDRIRVGEVFGDVIAVRLQVTHVRTPKNEEVVIPNSEILGKEVVNYSSLAASHGLLLHTTVGIGYETPWRQVEAMLLLAAQRAPGLLTKPEPFVLQKALGDFCITYELNAACDNPQAMSRLYTELHRAILDVFNEYGVQIMTPAYEGDPEQPKIVPREQWYLTPATAGDQRSPGVVR